jgi:CRISPR-associated endonuclease/helicase Cas3
MANSIIILDEIQSIQIEKWGDIRFLINEYAKKFDIYFVLMTATQPKLIDKPVELSGQNFRDRFKKMDRVSMFFDLNPDTVNNVLDKYINSYQEVTGISMLFVFNTIKTSIEAHNYLKKKQIKNLFYISSNIVPIKRMEVINKILNAIKNKEKIIVVGTQILEAGIDISFDVVVRDLAPIDSIIQSSGRVNRHGADKKGNIYVVNISPENKTMNGYYSKIVYGKLHTDISLKILNMYNGKTISEVDYLELIEKYYDEITKAFPASSENLKQSFEKLSYTNDSNEPKVSDFTLIDDKGYVSIFVEIDESAHNTIEEYKKYKNNGNSYNDENIIRLKKEINNYIVQTRENNIKDIYYEPLNKGNNFLIIRKDYLQRSYSDETGIKLTIEDEEGGDLKWNII